VPGEEGGSSVVGSCTALPVSLLFCHTFSIFFSNRHCPTSTIEKPWSSKKRIAARLVQVNEATITSLKMELGTESLVIPRNMKRMKLSKKLSP
jgi:hypothetical protein